MGFSLIPDDTMEGLDDGDRAFLYYQDGVNPPHMIGTIKFKQDFSDANGIRLEFVVNGRSVEVVENARRAFGTTVKSFQIAAGGSIRDIITLGGDR